MKYNDTEDIKFLKEVMKLDPESLALISQIIKAAYAQGRADQANTAYQIIKK